MDKIYQNLMRQETNTLSILPNLDTHINENPMVGGKHKTQKLFQVQTKQRIEHRLNSYRNEQLSHKFSFEIRVFQSKLRNEVCKKFV